MKQNIFAFILQTAFFVSSVNFFLAAGTMNCDFPQGSISGPLFLLYINDIPKALSNSHTCLCADNTNIFYQRMGVAEIKSIFR